MSQSQKIFTFGVWKKIKNGYLGICSDGFHFLSLWQMMPKIIELFFYVYS